MSGVARIRCAYVVSRYPSMTHTFVVREARALRARGHEIVPVSVRRSDEVEIVSEADRREAANTFTILPASPWKILRAHLAALLMGPSAYLRTLAETLGDAPAGLRTTTWQLFYFVEAMILWRRLDRQRLFHVHVHHGNVGADLAMISTRFGNRISDAHPYTWTMTIHGPTELADVPGHKLALKLARADAVVTVSDFARAQLLPLVDAEQGERIQTVHCGIEPSNYSANGRGPGEKGRMRVLSVARLDRRKGLSVLLDALAQLREQTRAIELTIVGDGPARPEIERGARELGIEDAVTLVGAVGQDQVADFYGRADVFCLPSFAEGIPIVLMEAMASGLPVVATRVMGVPELVEDDCGLLVSPACPDEIAAALARLSDDPKLRARLGEAGRRKVEADFDLSASARSLESILIGITANEG